MHSHPSQLTVYVFFLQVRVSGWLTSVPDKLLVNGSRLWAWWEWVSHTLGPQPESKTIYGCFDHSVTWLITLARASQTWTHSGITNEPHAAFVMSE